MTESREAMIEAIVKATQWLVETPNNRREDNAPDGMSVVFATTRNSHAGREGVYFGTSVISSSIVLQDHADPSLCDYVPQTYRESQRLRLRTEVYPPLANGYDIDLGALRKFSDETLERMAEKVRRVLKDNG